MAGNAITVRNRNSVRPYQHVIEPLSAYLLIAQKQYEDMSLAGYYNVGPDEKDCVTTGELVELFCGAWEDGAAWSSQNDNGPHEANYLKLDCSKIKTLLGWKPVWDTKTAVERTVEWTKVWQNDPSFVPAIMERQIGEYLNEGGDESYYV